MGFLGILGHVLAPFARPIEGLVNSVLKVRMMAFAGFAPTSRGIRRRRSGRRRSASTRWPTCDAECGNDVEAKPCISPRPFPRCPNFPCQRRPVHVNHVTNFGHRVEPLPPLHMSQQPRRNPRRWLALARLTLICAAPEEKSAFYVDMW